MRVAVLGLVAMVVACYAPTYEGLACEAGTQRCPDGYQCVDNVCLEDLGICGDGVRSGTENCDDGNTETEAACEYGVATCMRCSLDCSLPFPLTGPYCGDRLVAAGFEACDDGNSMPCGSCNETCDTNLVPTAATGMLMNVESLTAAHEGRTFTMLDGVRIDRLSFEIDTDNSVTLPNIRVDITAAGGGPVNGVITAINASALMIDASPANPHVRVTNQLLSGRGNQPIETNIPAPFSVTGMSGGAGGDCASGVGCRNNGDCFSNSCQQGTCQ
jgi:hypothetical protein